MTTNADEIDGSTAELSVAARHSALFGVGIVVSNVMQFGFMLVVTHTIQQRLAGAFFEGLAIFTIFSNVGELGADSGLLRFMPIARARGTRNERTLAVVAVVPAFLCAAALGVIAFLFSLPLSRFFAHKNHDFTSSTLRILAVFLPAATVLTVVTAGLRAWGPRLPVILNYMLIPAMRYAIYLPLLVAGIADSPAWAWTGPIAVAAVLALVGLHRTLPKRRADRDGQNPGLSPTAREFWRYSAPRSLAAAFQVLVTWVDVLLVGHLLSTRYAAAYTGASRYILVVITIGQGAIGSAIAPQFESVDGRP